MSLLHTYKPVTPFVFILCRIIAIAIHTRACPYPPTSGVFEAMDTDNDGRISSQEFVDALAQSVWRWMSPRDAEAKRAK